MQTDIRFIRANHEELKSNLKDNFEEHTNDKATLTGDILRTRQDALSLRAEFEASGVQAANSMQDLIQLKSNISDINSGIEALRINMQSVPLEDIQGELQGQSPACFFFSKHCGSRSLYPFLPLT